MTETAVEKAPEDVTGPRLDRSITLRWQGDSGAATLHRICGWLTQEVTDRCGRFSRSVISSGRAQADAARAVGRGEVDISLATPAQFVAQAIKGLGLHDGEPMPHLRALGTIPQFDRLVVAVPAETGIRSFADWRKHQLGLRIATAPADGTNYLGFAARKVMEYHGIPESLLREWGGGYITAERPFPSINRVRDGQADVVIHEGISAWSWTILAEQRDVVFIPLEDEPLARLRAEYGWPDGVLPAGYWKGLDADLRTLDYSDFVLITTEHLPDDLAYLIAWCLVETREVLEAQFRQFPVDRSPVTCPLDPVRLATTPIPLHPGAAKYFDNLTQ